MPTAASRTAKIKIANFNSFFINLMVVTAHQKVMGSQEKLTFGRGNFINAVLV
jgi:hypothetical protein